MSHSNNPCRKTTLDRFLPLLLLLFVGSGCAALIYEIVWFQLLQFMIGSSAISLGVLLGTFMGGMCLGSLALPYWIGRTRHPLCVYAVLELGIAVIGVGLVFGLPYLNGVYAAIATPGDSGVFARALIAAVCLLPPTVLMGATLPAVARSVEATPHGVSWLGFFYGGNIAGAVVGCLFAGFYLLRVYDMTVATYVAASINVAVAAAAMICAWKMPIRQSASQDEIASRTVRPRRWGVYAAIALSGAAALGAEVVWTRLLSLLIGGTVYTFSIILAVFLIGLGIGSSWGAWLARRNNPRLALGVCQLLLTAAIFWAAYQSVASLPYWPIDPSLSQSPWYSFQLDLIRSLWAILPPACLWGASFPLALAAAASPGEDAGRLVGGIYAANTLGAIAGAIGFSTMVIPMLGTQHAQQVLIVLAALACLVALIPLVGIDISAQRWRRPTEVIVRGGSLAALLAVAAWLAFAIPSTPGELIAYGRYLASHTGSDKIVYQGEGMNSSVAVSLSRDGVRSFHVSGKVEASSLAQDMRLQRMLGHIPALVHSKPKTVLVVGCGAGVTAGSFLTHPSVERVVICEIEPLIPQVVARYFDRENYGVASGKNRTDGKEVEIVYDDARHFIRTTNETFDIITSDPINPWVKGAATLYTQEYFELCKQRLNPGGIITQWVPLYESTPEAVKSELATFFEVFPDGTVWSNDQGGAGYDIVVLGQRGPLAIDVEKLALRMMCEDHTRARESLSEVGFESPLDLLATYAGAAGPLRPWLADAEINRDQNLRLQYLAGAGANNYAEVAIYDEMLTFRNYPEQLFVASAENANELKRRLKLGIPQP